MMSAGAVSSLGVYLTRYIGTVIRNWPSIEDMFL